MTIYQHAKGESSKVFPRFDSKTSKHALCWRLIHESQSTLLARRCPSEIDTRKESAPSDTLPDRSPVSISWTKRDDVIYFVHPVRGGERLFQLNFFPPGRVTCLDRSGDTLPGEPLEVLVDQVIKRLESLSKP